jgi:ribosomal protein L37AE/L43A
MTSSNRRPGSRARSNAVLEKKTEPRPRILLNAVAPSAKHSAIRAIVVREQDGRCSECSEEGHLFVRLVFSVWLGLCVDCAAASAKRANAQRAEVARARAETISFRPVEWIATPSWLSDPPRKNRTFRR